MVFCPLIKEKCKGNKCAMWYESASKKGVCVIYDYYEPKEGHLKIVKPE